MVPHDMTDVAVTDAKQRLERIRAHLASAAEEYAAAVLAKDWETLSYPDLESWRDAILDDKRFTAQTRATIAATLDQAGMPVRAIAEATGVGKSTTDRDLATVPKRDTSNPRKDAARQREQTKPKVPVPGATADNPANPGDRRKIKPDFVTVRFRYLGTPKIDSVADALRKELGDELVRELIAQLRSSLTEDQ
jgi:hypothetical protein